MKFYTHLAILTLLLAFAFSSPIKDDQVTDNLVDGGISLHITNDFLSTIKNQVIDTLIEIFQPDHVSMTDTFNAGLFNFTYNVTDLTVHAFKMNYKDSKIQFRKDSPNIHVEFIDLVMYLTSNYSMYAQPQFYLDEGQWKIAFAFANVSVGINMIRDANGVFQFEANEIIANYTGSDMYFTGGGDLSYILNTASFLLNGSLVQDPSNTVKTMVQQVLPIINGQLQAIGCTYNTTGLEINWCAMEDPKFDDQSLSLIFKGETTYEEKPIPFVDQRKIPYKFEDGKDVQISISDYFLNTTIYSAFYLGLLEGNATELNNQTITAGNFTLLWPKITDHLSPDQPIMIKVVANETFTPYLEIVDGKTTVRGLADITFSSINGTEDEVFLELTSEVNITVDLEIQTPFKVLTNIKQLKIKASQLTTDKYGLTNLDDLNSLIGAISGFIRNLLNKELSGYSNSIIEIGVLLIDLKDTLLNERERYIWFDSRPQFSYNITSDEKKSKPEYTIEDFKPKEVTYQDKVDAVAKLIKLTPIFKGIQDLKKNQQLYENLQFINPVFGQRMAKDERDWGMPKEREDEIDMHPQTY